MNTEYLQFRLMSLLARRLPRPLSYAIGAVVSDALFRRQPAVAAAIAANHRRIRDYQGVPASEQELAELARVTYRGFSRHLADFFRFPSISPRQVARMCTVEGIEHADPVLARGKGMLAVSAHIGSWELSMAVLRALGYPMHLIVLPMKDPKTNALFERVRLRHNTSLIPLGTSLRPILKALRANEIVGIAGDIDYSMRTDLVPIFGAPARVPIGPARLAVMTGAPIVMGTLHQKPRGRYLLRLHPPIYPDHGLTADAIQERIVRFLELEILDDPTQWFALFDYWNLEASLALSREAGAP
jgi:KDO2-lipid IV(A) lauroyltransferase